MGFSGWAQPTWDTTQYTIIVLSLRIFEVQTWSFDQVWFYPFEVSSKYDEICVNMTERYLLTSDGWLFHQMKRSAIFGGLSRLLIQTWQFWSEVWIWSSELIFEKSLICCLTNDSRIISEASPEPLFFFFLLFSTGMLCESDSKCVHALCSWSCRFVHRWCIC